MAKKSKKMDFKMYADYLIYGAVGAVVLAGLGYLGLDIWLASTQWLLIAVVLGVFGLYIKK